MEKVVPHVFIFRNKRLEQALFDIKEGIGLWSLWSSLAWQDIRLRYRRSALGPLWITISMAVMIYTLGTVYSFLFKTNIAAYFPHVASGILVWSLISSTTLELLDTFIESSHFIKQVKLPFTTYILRNLTRNAIIFAHNFFAIVPLLIYYHLSCHLLALFCGLLLLLVIAFSFGTMLAMLGARYRDLRQLTQSLLQLIFYVTPVMWMVDMLPPKLQVIVKLNPFYHMIELLRAPLSGNFPSLLSYSYSLFLAAIGVGCMLLLMIRARHRIPFWV